VTNETATSRQLIVCSLGNEEYALPITDVQEIIRYSEPRTIPSAPLGVRGVINLRGRIIPVCDLTQRLGLVIEPGPESKIIVVEVGEDVAGLIVDDVTEVMTVTADKLEQPRAGQDRVISAIAKVGDRLLVVLDLAMVLGGESELNVLPAAA
jgi:purine-binding chemotaxis protein CheW